jgi:DNA-binding beta-propeller fold protein YncE
MLALYRSGRQTEALESYRDFRRTLSADLGLEPGPELQRLERSILRHDDSLDLPASPEEAALPAPRQSRVFLAVAAGVALAALAAALAWVLLARGDEPAEAAPVVETAASRTLAAIPVPLPACCGFGFGSVWAAGHHDSTVHRIDPETNSVIRRLHGVGYQAHIPVVAAGSVWVSSAADPLTRIDPVTGRVVARIPVSVSPLAFGFLTIWGTTLDHRLVQVDLKTNRVTWSLRLAPGSNSWLDELAIGYGSIWVAVADQGTLLRIDPSTRRIVARIGGFAQDDSGMPIAVGEGAVWALRVRKGENVLFRVDPRTNRIVARIRVGPPVASPPTGTVAVGGGYVWTGNSDASVSKVDPARNTLVATYRLESQPQNLSFGLGSLWVDSYDASRVWRIDPQP